MKKITLLLSLIIFCTQVVAKPMDINKTKSEAIDCLIKAPIEDIFYKISSVIGEIEETYSPTNGKAFITIVIIKFDSQSCDQIQELRYSYLCPDFMMPYCFKSVPVLTNCNREEKRLSFSCDKLEENE